METPKGLWPRCGGWLLALVLLFAPLARPADVAQAETMDRKGSSIPRYNFPPPSRGDRFARNGLDLKEGIRGWKQYGQLIKAVGKEQHVDPFVIGAYIWVESNFDPHQDFANSRAHAIGLGSVQPADYRYKYSEAQLMEPYLNVTLTAKEFREKWHPNDLSGTVMDVWYPAWRRRQARGERLPVVQYPEVYVQAIANRYYALQEIDRHLILKGKPKPRPVKPPTPIRAIGLG
ncbi:MAG: hypothetical protein JWM80_1447 [Cyanobacteria bacterium RYN_339]|nr:hypothetical protein [Cyanobacteria bacterium RYN_339]